MTNLWPRDAKKNPEKHFIRGGCAIHCKSTQHTAPLVHCDFFLYELRELARFSPFNYNKLKSIHVSESIKQYIFFESIRIYRDEREKNRNRHIRFSFLADVIHE